MNRNLFPIVLVFLFFIPVSVSAFTAIRPDVEHGTIPDSPAVRQAKMNKDINSDPSSASESETRGSSYTGGSYSGTSPSSGSPVHVTSTPTPTPSATKFVFVKFDTKSSKVTKVVLFVVLFLVVALVAGWYFTRNVNFNRLFHK